MISIILPVYNESENIPILLDRISVELKDIEHEIIFVDDSTDNTTDLIKEEIKKRDGNILLKHRENERGLASAVLAGFKMASGNYISVMDSDLQHPPETLSMMYCAMLEGADVCIPSRFIQGGSDGGLNVYRKLVSFVARYIGKLFIYNLRHITDPTSGMFMLKKDILNHADLKPIGWKICIEVMAVCKYNKVVEIPYKFQNRENGKSKLSFKVELEYIKQLFMLLPRCSKNKNLIVEKWSLEYVQTKKQNLYLGR